MKKINYLFLALLASIALAACKQDKPEQDINIPDKKTEKTVGRFDNVPFQWDIIHAPNHPADDVFIGSKNLFVPQGAPSQVSSADRDGNNRGGYRGSDIFILNPVGIYVGAAYPVSALNNSTFDQDITKTKNQFKLIYDFVDPYLDKIDNADLFEYKTSFKKAINSEEHKKQQNAAREQLEYYFTEFSSYSDIEKSFEGDLKLGKIFSSKVSYNSKKTNIQGRLIAKLISKNFSVVMAAPSEKSGFFNDSVCNTDSGWERREPPVYIRSITYGKVAFVAIESEYSYSEVKKALEAGINYKFIDGKLNMDEKTLEVFSKSTITILAINDDTKEISFSNNINVLDRTLSLNYSNVSYGVPIYYQGRYVTNNKLFTPTYQSDNNGGGRDTRLNERNDGAGRRGDNTGGSRGDNTGGRRGDDTGSSRGDNTGGRGGGSTGGRR